MPSGYVDCGRCAWLEPTRSRCHSKEKESEIVYIFSMTKLPPRDHNRPSFRRFDFFGERLDSICCGFSSRRSAIAHQPPDSIETEIVVSARKGRSTRPISHRMAHFSKERPGARFHAVVDERIYEQMCDDADRNWAKEKEVLRRKIAVSNQNIRNIEITELPIDIRERIQIGSANCWLWFSPRKRNKRGNLRANKKVNAAYYGRVKFGGVTWASHRLIYTLLIGEIPKGAVLRHDCDTPACVNPLHLRPGIVEDNVRDMIERGRAGWQRHNKEV